MTLPSDSAAAPPRKFTFDTVFDGGRVIAPAKPRRSFTQEEVEAARAQGVAEGQRSALSRTETQAAAALADIGQAMRQAMPTLSALVQEHKAGAARLALACGRAIADAALDAFPKQPAMAALHALAREVEAQPRLTVRTSSADLAELQAALAATAEAAGFAGQVIVKAEPGLPPAAFSFDWGEGRAAFDPVAAAARVEAALEQALAAERLHAPSPSIDPRPEP